MPLIVPSHSWVPARAIPTPAAAVGFNTRTFFDDFNSISTIDMSLTKAAGFKWYLSNSWPNAFNSVPWNTAADTDPASISVSNSNFIKTTAGNTVNQGIHTAVPNGSTWRGTTFKNGFYVEIKFSVNPYSSGSQAYAWPIYWFMPIEYLANGVHNFTELDGFELFSGPQNRLAIGDWTNGSGSSTFNSNDVWTTGPSDTSSHTYGKLWQTTTQGGGTGSEQNYYDGVLQSANTVTWTPGSLFSGLDAQHMMMIIDTGVGVTMTVDYIDVCQASAADIVVQT